MGKMLEGQACFLGIGDRCLTRKVLTNKKSGFPIDELFSQKERMFGWGSLGIMVANNSIGEIMMMNRVLQFLVIRAAWSPNQSQLDRTS